jgi:hypothetical protein
MITYRLFPPAIDRLLRRRFLVLAAVVVPLAVVIPLVMAVRSGGNWSVVAMSAPIIAIALGLGLFRAFRMARRQLESYRLTLDGEAMTRTQWGLPELTVYQDEVTDIVETPGQGLVIRTGDAQKVLVVPALLEGYGELRSLLANLREIRVLPPRTATWLTAIYVAVGLGAAAAMLTALLATDRLVVVLAGGFAVIVLAASLVQTQRNPTVDMRTKRISWMTLIPLLVLLIRVVSVFLV